MGSIRGQSLKEQALLLRKKASPRCRDWLLFSRGAVKKCLSCCLRLEVDQAL